MGSTKYRSDALSSGQLAWFDSSVRPQTVIQTSQQIRSPGPAFDMVGESRKLSKFVSKMGSGDDRGTNVGDGGTTLMSHLLTASCPGLIGVSIARTLSYDTDPGKASNRRLEV